MNNIHTITSIGLTSLQPDYSADPVQMCKDVIYTLEEELNRNPKCVDSLRDWITGYQALSGVYLQEGKIELAKQCLLIPHRSLLHMAKYNSGDHEQRHIAKEAMKLTLLPLLEFTKIYPLYDYGIQEIQ
jgi:hypothetical protein